MATGRCPTHEGYPKSPVLDSPFRVGTKRGWCVGPGPYSMHLEFPIFLSLVSVRLLRPISYPLTAVVLIAASFDNVQPNPSSASRGAISDRKLL